MGTVVLASECLKTELSRVSPEGRTRTMIRNLGKGKVESFSLSFSRISLHHRDVIDERFEQVDCLAWRVS